ncbi:hypothetical protein Bbelb_154720 [Branchiostoma belcheri]|nr:hypothetical protein Bbelb_154720 [Branchiostoma belcheri]
MAAIMASHVARGNDSIATRVMLRTDGFAAEGVLPQSGKTPSSAKSFVAEKILEANRYVGPVYFTFFMICIFILLVNFLVTIICDAIASGDSIDDDYDQDLVQFLLKAHEDDAARLQELQNESRRRAEAFLQRKLAERRRKEGSGKKQTIVEAAQDLMQQHAADEERLEKRQKSARRMFENKLRQKLAARRLMRTMLQELQNESRRRAEAILQRKLAERRRKEGSGKKQTIVETAQDLMQQHAADEERL